MCIKRAVAVAVAVVVAAGVGMFSCGGSKTAAGSSYGGSQFAPSADVQSEQPRQYAQASAGSSYGGSQLAQSADVQSEQPVQYAQASQPKQSASAKFVSDDGFAGNVADPVEELGLIKDDLNKNGIASEDGIGESNNEKVALRKAEGDARAKLVIMLNSQIGDLETDLMIDKDKKATELWDNVNKRIASGAISSATTYKKFKQYNKEEKVYKYYVLMYINPQLVKNLMVEELEKNKSLELSVQKDELMSKLDAAIEYQNEKLGKN